MKLKAHVFLSAFKCEKLFSVRYELFPLFQDPYLTIRKC